MMKLLFTVFTIFIVSCSYTKHNTCSINGNENYLKVSPLCSMYIPEGLTLPLSEQEYIIPSIKDNPSLNVGKNLNICPPVVAY